MMSRWDSLHSVTRVNIRYHSFYRFHFASVYFFCLFISLFVLTSRSTTAAYEIKCGWLLVRFLGTIFLGVDSFFFRGEILYIEVGSFKWWKEIEKHGFLVWVQKNTNLVKVILNFWWNQMIGFSKRLLKTKELNIFNCPRKIEYLRKIAFQVLGPEALRQLNYWIL